MLRMCRIGAFGLLVITAAIWPAAAQEGPGRGTLVVAGGGVRDTEIYRRFVDLAGGADAPIVVIPTAGGDDYGPYWPGLKPLKDVGATRLTVLHTNDPKVADTEAFVQPLLAARGVWFPGGRQWRLADAYLNTRTQREIAAVLERGGVVGGTSAGATILGSFMVRGDTKSNTIMVGDHTVGFGFLKGVTIDQHLLRRNRQFDLIAVVEGRPDLLGLGLDEDTAIVVSDQAFEVIGRSYVAVYDRSRQIDTGGLFYVLAPGDRFSLKTRQATRPGVSAQPIDRVVAKPWSKP